MRKWILIQMMRRKELRGLAVKATKLPLLPSLGDLVQDGRVDIDWDRDGD